MHVPCPHCRNAIEVVSLPHSEEVTCLSCGFSFRQPAGPCWPDAACLGMTAVGLALACASLWACHDGGVRPWLPWLFRAGLVASASIAVVCMLHPLTASGKRSRRPWVPRVAWVLAFGLGGFFLLILPQVVMVSAAAGRMMVGNNLHRVGVALHDYADAHGDRLPPAAFVGERGEPLLSWRVALLPYLGHQDLFDQFHLDEPWNSPHNLALLPQMPAVYASSRIFPDAPHHTRHLALVGPGTAFDGGEVSLTGGFPDGTSLTILVAEAAEPVPWTKPQDLPYDPDGPPPAFRETGDGWTAPSAFGVLFADAAVRAWRQDSLSDDQVRAAVTRNGGEKAKIHR